jgi:xanthine dehydrogenase small subunit
VAREDISLLEALREDLRVRSAKDGCSPQGQCGCCTVLVDGAARVACVTPLRRVAGRAVTTVDGLDPAVRDRLVGSFLDHGASQCGFCTPGIVCRLAALPDSAGAAQVENALLAHLCRCTGWRSIVDAATSSSQLGAGGPGSGGAHDREAAAARALIEGDSEQKWGADVVLGRGGFADDTAPDGCLVAVPRAGAAPGDLSDPDAWSTASTLAAARAAAGKVQGRRSGQPLTWPVPVPEGDWDITLQTTWVEPAYLEPDASWCLPGGEPASPVANGGAFGGKIESPAPAAARLLADHFGRPVRVLLSREDVVRFGPKRPPAAGGVRLDGTGALVLLDGPSSPLPWDESVRNYADMALNRSQSVIAADRPPAPGTSAGIRAAGWAEAAVLTAAAKARSLGSTAASVASPEGARAVARVEVDVTGWPVSVRLTVGAGDPLHEITLRSYIMGAAHMALGWVCSEGIAVGEDGVPSDLTIRSFGVIRAKDTPSMDIALESGPGPAVRASDAVFAAVAAATWLAQGLPSRWPTMRGTRR